jgi:hypothetical protein
MPLLFNPCLPILCSDGRGGPQLRRLRTVVPALVHHPNLADLAQADGLRAMAHGHFELKRRGSTYAVTSAD